MKRIGLVLAHLLFFVSLVAFGNWPKIGDVVWAEWKPNAWYHGKIGTTCAYGFFVNFDDGDKSCIHPSMIAVDQVSDAAKVLVGSRIIARWTDRKYYPGTVVRSAGENRFEIFFDDRDRRTVSLSEIRVRALRKNPRYSLAVGDVIWAQWKPNAWYHGKIGNTCAYGYFINFDDGDKSCIHPVHIAVDRIQGAESLKVGVRVIALWHDKKYYPGTVIKNLGGGTYQVFFDDRDTRVVALNKIRLVNK